MKNNKVRPYESYTGVSACFKYFFIIIGKLQFWTGLVPIKFDQKNTTMEFKLFSVSSLLASFRLLLFTFPLTILPVILYFGGPTHREYERATGKNYTGLELQEVGLFELCLTEYCLSLLIYILPLAFSYSAIENIKKFLRCYTEYQNMFVMDEGPRFIILRQVLFPLVGFLLFAVGKLFYLVYMVQVSTSSDSSTHVTFFSPISPFTCYWRYMNTIFIGTSTYSMKCAPWP